MSEEVYDVAVIGGGVVGCSTLFQLTNAGYACVLLEKNNDLVSEASSGNSGMLHCGFDVLPNSLEFDCIIHTQQRYEELFQRLGIDYRKVGATMLAWDQEQLQKFPAIISNGKAANTPVQQLSLSEIYQREPCLAGGVKGGLFFPGETIVDPWLIPIMLAHHARQHGAKILTNAEVNACTESRNEIWTLKCNRGPINCRTVINCAGLHGDEIDHLAGIHLFSIRPRKGQFVVYEKSAKSLLNSSILPVPAEKTKGIIVFRTLYDNLIVGPTAEDVVSRERAPIDDLLTKRLTQYGCSVLPTLTNYRIAGMYTGVRPATDTKDYHITAYSDRRWITVGGIRSTGLSGSMGISHRVLTLLQEELKLEPSSIEILRHTKLYPKFTSHNSVIIDGDEYSITHPITQFGMKQQANL